MEIYQIIARMPDGMPACVGATPSLVRGDVEGENFGALERGRARNRCVLVRKSDGAVLQAWGMRAVAVRRLADEWALLTSGVRLAA